MLSKYILLLIKPFCHWLASKYTLYSINSFYFAFRGQILPTQKAALSDPRRINCQICLNNSMDENMGNLFNLQKDKNDDFMCEK